jgi:hypothetical protein
MTSSLIPLTPEPSSWAQKYLAPKFWRSWAWLAALVGGFIPVLLPDALNWLLSHSDALIDFAFPTMDPLTKVLVLKVVVTLVLLLRPVKQTSMAAPAVPVLQVNVPPTLDLKGFDIRPADMDPYAVEPASILDTTDSFIRQFRERK